MDKPLQRRAALQPIHPDSFAFLTPNRSTAPVNPSRDTRERLRGSERRWDGGRPDGGGGFCLGPFPSNVMDSG